MKQLKVGDKVFGRGVKRLNKKLNERGLRLKPTHSMMFTLGKDSTVTKKQQVYVVAKLTQGKRK